MGIATGETIEAADVLALKDVDYPHYGLCLSAPSAVGQGTWELQGTAYLDKQMFNASRVDGDNISFDVSLRAGTYSIDMTVYLDNYNGVMDIDFDGIEKGSMDLYAGADSSSVYSITGIVVATDKVVTIKFRVDGKNGSSSGYGIGFGSVNIGRTA